MPRRECERLEPRWMPSAVAPARIYYDYVEHDQLQGGWIAADPDNPLHSLTAPGIELSASTSVATVQDNGPTSNRIDIVFLGDGYTVDELDRYTQHVEQIVPKFFQLEPLKEYSTYFNVHRVDVVSDESGVDHDPELGVLRDTALDMRYHCSGTERLLCVNVNKAIAEATAAPDVDQILAIANSSTYGGAGYAANDLATFAGGNGSSIEIGLHEFGHAFADLADEYDYGGPVVYPGPEPVEPNVSKLNVDDLASQSKKWYRWLDSPGVAAYEGGRYSVSGIYRPTDNSLMRSLGRPFEQVNAEQIVLSIYKSVSPIDDATAPGSYPADHEFFVKPLRPATHPLEITWMLDGQPISGVSAETFNPSTILFPPGEHELSVRVVDTTDLVRDETERAARMTASRSWTIDVPVPVPRVVDRWLVYAGTAHPRSSEGLSALLAPHPTQVPVGDCPQPALCGKSALLPGQTAVDYNYATNVQGITGVAVDLFAAAGPITPDDFELRVGNDPDVSTWIDAPPPAEVQWFAPGASGIGRAILVWQPGTIVNTWLQVTVLNNQRTGLSEPDVHYWGHQTGQVELEFQSDRVAVDTADLLAVVAGVRPFLEPAGLSQPLDLNRDGLIDGTDVAIVRDARTNSGEGLMLFTPPSGPAAVPMMEPQFAMLAVPLVGPLPQVQSASWPERPRPAIDPCQWWWEVAGRRGGMGWLAAAIDLDLKSTPGLHSSSRMARPSSASNPR